MCRYAMCRYAMCRYAEPIDLIDLSAVQRTRSEYTAVTRTRAHGQHAGRGL